MAVIVHIYAVKSLKIVRKPIKFTKFTKFYLIHAESLVESTEIKIVSTDIKRSLSFTKCKNRRKIVGKCVHVFETLWYFTPAGN